jgi:hypothetical protein
MVRLCFGTPPPISSRHAKRHLALFSMAAFIIVTDLFRTSRFPGFDYARPGTRLSYLLFLYLKISQAQPGSSICCRGSLAFSSYLVLSGLDWQLIRVTSGLLATALIFASGITNECKIPINFLPAFYARCPLCDILQRVASCCITWSL